MIRASCNGWRYLILAKHLSGNFGALLEIQLIFFTVNLFANKLTVKNINWISNKAPKLPLKCLARIRYRQPLQEARIMKHETHNMKHDSRFTFQVLFDKPQRAITPGQSAVFYLPVEARKAKESVKIGGLEMLGGGIID